MVAILKEKYLLFEVDFEVLSSWIFIFDLTYVCTVVYNRLENLQVTKTSGSGEKKLEIQTDRTSCSIFDYKLSKDQSFLFEWTKCWQIGEGSKYLYNDVDWVYYDQFFDMYNLNLWYIIWCGLQNLGTAVKCIFQKLVSYSDLKTIFHQFKRANDS